MVTRQQAFPSRWLQAADFPKPAVVEIVETDQAQVRGNDGQNTKKLALYFRGQRKALIVNATNFDSIARITGEGDSDAWAGHRIELYATTTEMAGRTVPCLRTRPPGTAPKKAVRPVAKPEPEPEAEEGGEFGDESENPAVDADDVF
jgi:hypothetical protein